MLDFDEITGPEQTEEESQPPQVEDQQQPRQQQHAKQGELFLRFAQRSFIPLKVYFKAAHLLGAQASTQHLRCPN